MTVSSTFRRRTAVSNVGKEIFILDMQNTHQQDFADDNFLKNDKRRKKRIFRWVGRGMPMQGPSVVLMVIFSTIMYITFYHRVIDERTVRKHKILLQSKPLVVGCYFSYPRNFEDDFFSNSETIEKDFASKIVRVRRLPVFDLDRYPSKRQMEYSWTSEDEEAQKKLRDSRKYANRMPLIDDKCQLEYEWQSGYLPTCNLVNEIDFTRFFVEESREAKEKLRLGGHGFWRDVWMVFDPIEGSTFALKTLRYEQDFSARNFDRHRRDAVITERAASKSHVMDIYAHCGNTMLAEFSSKTLSDVIWPNNTVSEPAPLSVEQKYVYALQVAQSINDLHTLDDQDVVSVVHTDLTPSQFLLSKDGSVKINDFNRARFISFSKKHHRPCTFMIGLSPGKYRSPEEYNDMAELNEKIDIYQMGNVVSISNNCLVVIFLKFLISTKLYSILTGKWIFEEFSDEIAAEKISSRERPKLPDYNHPLMASLANVIKLCWLQKSR